MSLECGECEADLRGGHLESCSRYKIPQHSYGWGCVICGPEEGDWCKLEKPENKKRAKPRKRYEW